MAILRIASIPEWSLTFDSIKSISIFCGSLLASNFELNVWTDPKNKGPHISYTLVPSPFIFLRARIIVAFFQANTRADITTPANTAIAKSIHTVMAETAINTKASAVGILLIILKLLQAKVPMTTINMTPTKAAIGICSISDAPKSTKHNNVIAAVIPDKRPRPPESTLMID